MANQFLIVISDVIPTVEIIMRTLKNMGSHYQFKIVFSSNVKIEDFFSGEYKILFIRCIDPSLLPILKKMVHHKIPYYFYLDDNCWELAKGEGFLAECYSAPIIVKTLNYMVQHAKLVIACSKNLKNYIKSLNSRVIAIKAAFDFELVEDLKKVPSLNPPIKIIYSGSIHREQDFQVIEPALKKILTEYGNEIGLYFKGFVPQGLKHLANVYYDETFYPYSDYIKAQFQFAYDIGIAPIQDSLPNRAKSNLKYREYSACGIAGIYSNIPPYSDCITQGENGYLVEHNEQSWYQALKALIDDKMLREKIVKNASADLFLNYTHASIAPLWKNSFENLPLVSSKLSRVDYFFMKLEQKQILIIHALKRSVAYYKQHGVMNTNRQIFGTLWGILWARKKPLKIKSF
ncbi:MAG: glycosyltransferase [Proteobacteria bacterium]|nr:glycosyltransferase [Pseudomonadota bacterium]